MQKKTARLATFLAILLFVWIYWTSNSEYHSTLRFLKQNYVLKKRYLIKPNNTTCEESSFIVILVTSYVGNVELRSAHRRAMPDDYLKQYNTKRIFLLARIPNRERYITQEAIKDESDAFGDILQGSFDEHYRNLTLKHLMGLDWAATNCLKATYILKVDDDTVFSLDKTYQLLKSESNIDPDMFLLGYILNGTKPRRNKQNKWYVTQEEYPRNYYPPYVSGWYYITTPTLAAALVEESSYHTQFWIDDILITGVLTEALNIKLRQLPHNYWLEYYELLECCLRDMVTKLIKCDYAVGPNGGRSNLIYEFKEGVCNCDTWKNCTTRTNNQPLSKVCVAYRERTIFSEGHPEVESIRL